MLTGGAGFVGLNVADQLLAAGADVVTYGLEEPPERFLATIGGHPGRLWAAVGDVRDRDSVLSAMRTFHVDRVVHGAAITAGQRREASAANDIASVNLLGTIEVLEASITHGIARVVQLGSGSVYGAAANVSGALDEVADRPVPDSLYGITKYAAERVGIRYRSTRGLDLTVARLGVVFGPWEYDTGQRDTLSIPLQLMDLAGEGGAAKFVSTLPDDWIYVKDVAAVIVRLLADSSAMDPVLHVATGERWPVVKWCDLLRQHFPRFNYQVVQDRNLANIGLQTPNERAPLSIDRLRDQLHYEPTYLLSNAMDDYVSWWRQFTTS